MVLDRRKVVYMLLIAILVLLLSPFGWLLITGFKSVGELRAMPIHWWPHQPTLGNFRQALTCFDYLA